jgi:hypothetical protein
MAGESQAIQRKIGRAIFGKKEVAATAARL